MDIGNFILALIGISIALLIFANLAPSVSRDLLNNNYTCSCPAGGAACTGGCDKNNASSNALAGVMAPLITVVFIVTVLILVLKSFFKKK
jgi:hypothetical protein